MKKVISAVMSIAVIASMLTTIPTATSCKESVNGGFVTVFAGDETSASGTCGENLSWTLDSDGVLIISGTGAMYDGKTSCTYWDYYQHRNNIKEVIFEEGVTSVGDCAFGKQYSSNTDFPNITKVTLPSTLEKIGIMAFQNLKITTIDFPESLEIIGESSFSGSSLISVKLRNGMTLGGSAFQYCNSLKEVTIPKNLIYDATKIGGMGLKRPNGGFNYCTGIEKVVLEDGVTELPGSIFDFCSSLSEVVINSRDLKEVIKAGEDHETFETNGTNIIYKLYKGSTTEKTLRNAGYLTDENTAYFTDYLKLNEAIKEAEAVEIDKFTEESVKDLTTAIAKGKAVLDKVDAEQEEINNAANAIKVAINSLVKKPTEPAPSKSSSTSPTTKTTAKTTANPAAKATRNAKQVAADKKAAQKAMKQAKIKKLTVKSKSKKKINVTWKKVKKATGYQVQVSIKKNFKKVIFKKDLKKTKLNIKNKKIKSKKTYYVRVRAYATYKDTNNKTVRVYSKWNKKLRKVTVK